MIRFVCKLNANDTFSVENSETVSLYNKKQYHFTLWDKDLRKLYKIRKFFHDEAIDLYFVSLMVFYADCKVARADMPDAWTRQFEIYMPVLCVDKWNANKELLEKSLNFLTGDRWEFHFRGRTLNPLEKKVQEGMQHRKWIFKVTDTFCMLSGGLDSYIGAIDLISEGKKPIFVGNHNGGKGVSIYQNKVIELLSSHFRYDTSRFYSFYAAPLNSKENSTRSRSFLFFAHAILLASGMQSHIDLYIPENGFISLNVPLTIHRAGSLSTRTTHPYWMNGLRMLLNNLGIDVSLINPYQFKTKGEMMLECKDLDFLKDTAYKTMSCSHPDQGRWKGEKSPSHCGVCLPCTIRRAAFLKAGIEDMSVYRDKNFRNEEAKTNLRSYRLGVSQILQDGKPSILRIQESGPIKDNIMDYANLFDRGLQELKSFLDTI